MLHDGAQVIRDIIDLAEEVRPRLRLLTAAEFLALDLPPRRMILDPWLPEKGLAMIYSPRGTGKTLLALTSAYSIATGCGFLDFKVPTSRRVLYIDGEMPAQTMQERLATIVAGFENQPPDPSYFRMLSGDLTEGGLPDLGTVEGQAEFDAQIGDAEIIFADNISTLVRSGKENEAEGWALVQEWGCAIAGADVQSSLCIMQARTACSAAHRSARMCWTR